MVFTSQSLWLCPQIDTYWSTILQFIQRVTKFLPEKNPMLLLFGFPQQRKDSPVTSNVIPQANLQWILLTLLIACRNIFNHWISTAHLTLSEMVRNLKALLCQEKLNTVNHHTRSTKIWWSSFSDHCLTSSEKKTTWNHPPSLSPKRVKYLAKSLPCLTILIHLYKLHIRGDSLPYGYCSDAFITFQDVTCILSLLLRDCIPELLLSLPLCWGLPRGDKYQTSPIGFPFHFPLLPLVSTILLSPPLSSSLLTSFLSDL